MFLLLFRLIGTCALSATKQKNTLFPILLIKNKDAFTFNPRNINIYGVYKWRRVIIKEY